MSYWQLVLDCQMTTDLSNSIEKDILHNLIDEETRALDVVASWEELCSTYRVLEFSDPLSDTVRLEEFKWIIKEMNKFLTRMRKKLMTCRTFEITKQALNDSFTPTGSVNIDNRRSLAYQKLRQAWIMTMIANLNQKEQEQIDRIIEEGLDNGWN